MAPSTKKRLDHILVENGRAETLDAAERLIRAGSVYVDEEVADKPGRLYPVDSAIRIKEKAPYVSRGGVKLQGALQHFDIKPRDWICADIGASSGGFTDCLLQQGARHVFAVDVAYGQLHWRLRTDSRVTVLERLNIKNVSSSHITRPLDLAVFDTSFISLTQVIPPVLPFFGPVIRALALIKPQFELDRHEIPAGGVIRDQGLQLKAIEKIERFATSLGLQTAGVVPSTIKGPKGNQEYLIYVTRV